MRLYLDDDCTEAVLVQLLRRAGHDVQLPADVGLGGAADAVHLAHAIREDRVLLSKNHDDFRDLHLLILQALGHHPGIFMVCQENNPNRDLKAPGIVRAIRNLIAAGVPIRDELHILNNWR
jgi:predicted nuclease of predicted toxin-antitoxin system